MPKLGRRNEPHHVEYLMANAPSNRYAPFGTDYSPIFRTRIVGGKLVPCVERPANPQGGLSPRAFPRVETLHPITDKPNHLDPAMLKEYTRKLYQMNQEFNNTSPGNIYGRGRPDSKDFCQRYPNLPPIDQNKVKMERSTVFEPEPWLRGYQPSNKENNLRVMAPYDTVPYQDTAPAGNYYSSIAPAPVVNGNHGSYNGTEAVFNDNQGGYHAAAPVGYQSTALYEPPPQKQIAVQPSATSKNGDLEENIMQELLSRLPHDTFLPEDSLHLTREEESVVLKLVAWELSDVNPAKLKDAYLDITENYDRTLSGWCHYKNVFFALSTAKIDLTGNLLHLVAAMFVSPAKLQEVNYEKFLSFIGTAMKSSEGGTSLHTDLHSSRESIPTYRQGQYYMQNNDAPKPWSPRASRPVSPYLDSNVGKLLNMTEQQLHEEEVDYEGLRMRFQGMDREMRETLSAQQIKDVLRAKSVKLQESVINKILHKCEGPNNDGQYNWTKFLDFLEKVHPAKTGLPIPRSKQPLEYVKKVPSPVPNWPRASDPTGPLPGVPVTPLWRKETHDQVMSARDPEVQDMDQMRYDQDEDQLRTNRETIERMDRDLKNLEAGYEIMKKKINSPRDDSPWFKMFMEFATALYKQDSHNTGQLPSDEVLNWTDLYNSSYNLDIPQHVIARTLGDCMHGGKVNVHKYLTKLGERNW